VFMLAIQNYGRGKITKACSGWGQLIDRYAEARSLGVPGDLFREAREHSSG
jgi:hypothetical protein